MDIFVFDDALNTISVHIIAHIEWLFIPYIEKAVDSDSYFNRCISLNHYVPGKFIFLSWNIYLQTMEIGIWIDCRTVVTVKV